MSTIAQYDFAETLAPLEFGGRELTVACTPAAVDLAAVGLGAAGIGYFAAKAFFHRGNFEETEGPLDSGAARHDLLPASELLSVRADELTRR
ncbi:hypothetical protein ABJI51_03065 [Amycolatopsis sp. NEAU-NG30]|uniref:Uncharacterized protein n=1 Tax=Amycolatopsis melonis TaxID=3156488 RepID=A0ABV0L7V0_9PSEU